MVGQLLLEPKPLGLKVGNHADVAGRGIHRLVAEPSCQQPQVGQQAHAALVGERCGRVPERVRPALLDEIEQQRSVARSERHPAGHSEQLHSVCRHARPHVGRAECEMLSFEDLDAGVYGGAGVVEPRRRSERLRLDGRCMQ